MSLRLQRKHSFRDYKTKARFYMLQHVKNQNSLLNDHLMTKKQVRPLKISQDWEVKLNLQKFSLTISFGYYNAPGIFWNSNIFDSKNKEILKYIWNYN